MILHKIDKKTRSFLEELQKDNIIHFQEVEMDFCAVHFNNGVCTISYNPKTVITEHITHELLHIWLEKFNYISGNYIFINSMNDRKLCKVFDKSLCDYIGNCLDHFKMYPKYCEMGYSAERFLRDGLAEKCTVNNIQNLNLSELNTYNSRAINYYIGCLISVYADHIENDYSEHLEIFKKIDSELFKIVTEFWKSWEVFDITNIDPIHNSDINLMEKFVSEMKIWCANKVIM